MAGGADQAIQLLRRVLQSAANDERARVDALVALGQRTLFAALWPGQDKYIRTLTNPAGETAMPLFTGRDLLEATATQLGWREPDGSLSWRELGAREAVRHALARGAHYVVMDLGAPHAIDFKREEMEPLLNRRAAGGPTAQDVAITAAVRSASQPPGHRSSFVPPPLAASEDAPHLAPMPAAAPVPAASPPAAAPAAPMPSADGGFPTTDDDGGGFPTATAQDAAAIPHAPAPAAQHATAQSDPPPPVVPPPPSFASVAPEPADDGFAMSASMAPPSVSPPMPAFENREADAVVEGAEKPEGDDSTPDAEATQSAAETPAVTFNDSEDDDTDDTAQTDTAAQIASAARDKLSAASEMVTAAGAAGAARAAATGLAAGAGAARAAATGLASRFRRGPDAPASEPPAAEAAAPDASLGLSDDALDAIGEALRRYPEVEWACCMPEGGTAPEVGLRIDPAFTARADEICGAMAAAAAASNETLNVNVLDTLEKARTVRQQGTVFFPGRRRARPRS